MPQLECNDFTLYYEVSGDSSRIPLVLSNSLGTSLEMWDAQIAHYEREYFVIRYDMRGHGRSSTPASPFTIEQCGNDVLRLLDELSLSQVNFCGLSIGGMIGQAIAANHSDRIDRLILANTSAKIGTDAGWNTRISQVESNGMSSISEGVMPVWFTSMFRAEQPEKVLAMKQMLEANDPYGYTGVCAAIRDADFRESIKKITAPTLIIAGSKDPATTVSAAEYLQASITKAHLVELPAAHISNVERPEEFTALTMQFLSGVTPK